MNEFLTQLTSQNQAIFQQLTVQLIEEGLDDTQIKIQLSAVLRAAVREQKRNRLISDFIVPLSSKGIIQYQLQLKQKQAAQKKRLATKVSETPSTALHTESTRPQHSENQPIEETKPQQPKQVTTPTKKRLPASFNQDDLNKLLRKEEKSFHSNFTRMTEQQTDDPSLKDVATAVQSSEKVLSQVESSDAHSTLPDIQPRLFHSDAISHQQTKIESNEPLITRPSVTDSTEGLPQVLASETSTSTHPVKSTKEQELFNHSDKQATVSETPDQSEADKLSKKIEESEIDSLSEKQISESTKQTESLSQQQESNETSLSDSESQKESTTVAQSGTVENSTTPEESEQPKEESTSEENNKQIDDKTSEESKQKEDNLTSEDSDNQVDDTTSEENNTQEESSTSKESDSQEESILPEENDHQEESTTSEESKPQEEKNISEENDNQVDDTTSEENNTQEEKLTSEKIDAIIESQTQETSSTDNILPEGEIGEAVNEKKKARLSNFSILSSLENDSFFKQYFKLGIILFIAISLFNYLISLISTVQTLGFLSLVMMSFYGSFLLIGAYSFLAVEEKRQHGAITFIKKLFNLMIVFLILFAWFVVANWFNGLDIPINRPLQPVGLGIAILVSLVIYWKINKTKVK